MGNLANAGGALQTADPQNDFKAILTAQWPKIEAVMPAHMSANRLFQLAVSAYNQTPKLAECSVKSVLSCIMKCGALGLEPSAVDGLGRAYILPYKNGKTRTYEATFILGYRGIIDLARRSGQIDTIHAQAVYEGDEFTYWEDETGQHFNWRPDRYAQHTPDALTDVYMTAHFKDGGRVIEHMTRAEVEKVRERSKAKDSGPWVTDFEAMALKSVVRKAAKWLPLSIEAQTAVAADETTPDYSGVLAPVVPVEVEPVQTGPADAQTPADAATGPYRAVCKSCGYVMEYAPADPSRIKFECCENPAFELLED